MYKKGAYSSKQILDENPRLKEIVDFIISKEILAFGDKESLTRLHKDIVGKDYFMAILDLEDYISEKNKMIKSYKNKERWSQKMIMNISKAGYFSSDRTIKEYNDDIWHL